MRDINADGGPAFPQSDLSGYGMGPSGTNNGGMSLRDWFAGQALAAMMGGAQNPEQAALFAYQAADEMMKERE